MNNKIKKLGSKVTTLEYRIAELERQNIKLVNLVNNQYENLTELWNCLRTISIKAGIIEPEEIEVECMGTSYTYVEGDPWPRFTQSFK